MKTLSIRGPKEFEAGFSRIRGELDIADSFPKHVLDAAKSAANRGVAEGARYDARDLAFVAIDPPGSTDLDQAFFASKKNNGFTMHYAIADVGAFVEPGDPLDVEARKRGATMYSPDQRAPLYPADVSEGSASLLPGQDRPALLWTFELDSDGVPTSTAFQRATIKVSEAISYSEAQSRIDRGDDECLALLKVIGSLRQSQERERGGVSLNLPAQEIKTVEGSYQLSFDVSLPVEGWNAQMSLLAGMTAGQAMADAGVGILRTLPPPNRQNIGPLRLSAQALGIEWPEQQNYADFVRSLEPNNAVCNALLVQATRIFRGAGYESFQGEIPDQPLHGAINSLYSHVTAPLRRLVDRFANEILLSIYADQPVPKWALEALDDLPSIMGQTKQKESALDRTMLNFAEALVLSNRVGEEFPGTVVNITDDGARATAQISDPAIVAEISGAGRSLAEHVSLELRSADTKTSTVDFAVVSTR